MFHLKWRCPELRSCRVSESRLPMRDEHNTPRRGGASNSLTHTHIERGSKEREEEGRSENEIGIRGSEERSGRRVEGDGRRYVARPSPASPSPTARPKTRDGGVGAPDVCAIRGDTSASRRSRRDRRAVAVVVVVVVVVSHRVTVFVDGDAGGRAQVVPEGWRP